MMNPPVRLVIGLLILVLFAYATISAQGRGIASSMIYMSQSLPRVDSSEAPSVMPMNNLLRSSFFDRTNLTRIFARKDSSMAIDSEGTLYSWGLNEHGHLGDGTLINRFAPSVQGYYGSSLSQLACGENHVLLLRNNSKLYSWGENLNGQLGDGTTTHRLSPVTVDLRMLNANSSVIQIAAGRSHSLILTDDGQLFQWGFRLNEESNTIPIALDMNVFSGSLVTRIGVGSVLSVALTSSGTLYQWDLMSEFQPTLPVPVDMSGVGHDKIITQISIGESHLVVLANDFKVYAWGRNNHGQVGDGTRDYRNAPVAVNGGLSGKKVTQIACGDFHTLALTSDGMLYGWGSNDGGQLGSGTLQNQYHPIAINISHTLSSDSYITQIAAGKAHSMILTNKGKSYSWGNNAFGQLGIGSTENNVTPVGVGINGVLDGKVITHISARSELKNFVATTKDGTVTAWGANGNGDVGDGTTIDKLFPVMVDSRAFKGIISQCTLGDRFTIAQTNDGVLYSWGYNTFGQLGIGSTQAQKLPVPVVMNGVLKGKTITRVAARPSFHVVVIANDNTLYSWGTNFFGQLGDGTYQYRTMAVAVDMSGALKGKNIVQVAVGNGHTVALTSDGQLYTWGANRCGLLEGNELTTSTVPVVVENNSDLLKDKTIVHITAGKKHTTVLTNDGQLYSWGLTDFGAPRPLNGPALLTMNGFLNGKKVSQFESNDDSILALTDDTKLAYWNHIQNYSTWVNMNNIDNMRSITSLFIGANSIGFLEVTCETGYYGQDCERFNCFNATYNESTVCSGNGRCADVDQCECIEGYGGRSCSYPVCNGVASINNKVCSSHGECIKPNTCVCNFGYRGDTCSINLIFVFGIIGLILCITLIPTIIVTGLLMVRKRRESRMKSELKACLLEELHELEVDNNIDGGDFYIDMKEIKLLSRISEGAFGVVFKGEWRSNLVAVKKMKVADDDSFIKEVSILQSLRHPNILYLYGYSSNDSGDKFLITEYAKNGSLDKLLYNGKKSLRDFDQKMSILIQIADTMAYLHDRSPRIVHRDLKPQNILLGDNYHISICDFGLSKITNTSFTLGRSYGTIEYCAPELLTHQEYDEKCDVYSFGIIMHEMFILANPYSQHANESIFTLGMDIVKGLRPSVPFDTNNGSLTNDPQTLIDHFTKSNSTSNITATDIPRVVQQFYSIVTRCWDSEKTNRPSFEDITVQLNEISRRN